MVVVPLGGDTSSSDNAVFQLTIVGFAIHLHHEVTTHQTKAQSYRDAGCPT